MRRLSFSPHSKTAAIFFSFLEQWLHQNTSEWARILNFIHHSLNAEPSSGRKRATAWKRERKGVKMKWKMQSVNIYISLMKIHERFLMSSELIVERQSLSLH
jgi:hypothetical protein